MMKQTWSVMAVAMMAAAGAVAQPAATKPAEKQPDSKLPPPLTPTGKPVINVQPGGAKTTQATPPPPGKAIQPAAPSGPPAPPPPPPRTAKTVKWSDTEAEKLGGMLAGTWKTTKPVAQFGGTAGATTDILINIAPVVVDGLSDTLYVEATRADATWAPYHQAIFQIHKFKGGLRLRTLEFHKASDGKPSEYASSLTGLWIDPTWFPDVKKDSLYATMDIDLKPQGAGFKGQTTVPYPTSASGAEEMTSEITIEPGKLTTADRWYGADGKVLYGSQPGEAYTFAKAQSPVKLKTVGDGLKVIEFKTSQEGKAIAEGDDVVAHYTGNLFDGGMKFNSSRDRGQPMGPFKQGTLIKGWNEGLIGYHEGDRVKLWIPWAKGLGERGDPRRNVPPYADLLFDIEVMKVEAPAAPGPAADGPVGPSIDSKGPAPKPAEPAAAPK